MPLRYWCFFICFLVAACNNNRDQDLRVTPELSAALDSAAFRADNGDPIGAATWLNNQYTRSRPTVLDNYLRLSRLTNIFYRSANYVMSMHYADSMGRILEESNLTRKLYKEYSESYFSGGDARYELGFYIEGARAYNEARLIGLENQDSCILSAYEYRLGMVLYRQGRYPDAADHFRKALQLNNSCAEESFVKASYVQQLMNNLGLSLLRGGETDNALTAFAQAIAVIENARIRYPDRNTYWNDAYAVVLGNQGEALTAKGLYDSASKNFRLALSFPEYEKDLPADAVLTKIKMADLYLHLNRADTSEEILKVTEMPARAVSDSSVIEQWLRSYVRLNEKKGSWYLAFEALQAADRLAADESFLKRHYIMQDLNDKVLELDQSRRYGIMLESQRNKNRLIVVIVICSLIIALSALVVLVNYQKSKVFIGQLSGLNKTIRRQKSDLETALKEIQRTHQDKDQIMRMVAHDLRSPVASIYWMANVMLEEDDLSAEQRENLNLIKLASSNSLSMSKDILEAVTMLGNTDLNKSRIVLNDLVTQQAQLVRGDAETKGLKLILELPDEPVIMLGDAEQLGRVLNNLIYNSIKFSADGGTITLTLKREGSNSVISIKDHGIGIPTDIQDRVFDVFTESKRMGTKGEKSYGLGLSIARRITELHNGTIRFESQPGIRTVFYITLPLED